jgi:hypothetical protein
MSGVRGHPQRLARTSAVNVLSEQRAEDITERNFESLIRMLRNMVRVTCYVTGAYNVCAHVQKALAQSS